MMVVFIMSVMFVNDTGKYPLTGGVWDHFVFVKSGIFEKPVPRGLQPRMMWDNILADCHVEVLGTTFFLGPLFDVS